MNKARIVIGCVLLLAGIGAVAMFVQTENGDPRVLLGGIAVFVVGVLVAGGKKGWNIIKKTINIFSDIGGNAPRTKL